MRFCINKFDFRDECLGDIFLLLDEVSANDRILTCTFIPERISPDVGAAFFASCQLNKLLVIARSVENV